MRTCTNCDAAIEAVGGRPPKDGRWYCTRPQCQAARARRRRADRAGIEVERMEDRPCSFCGDLMHPRPWRITDVEEGRWCRKTRCTQAKPVMLEILRTGDQALTLKFLERVRDHMERVECRSCGFEDALLGLPHPKPNTSNRAGNLEICYAFSRILISITAALYAWPGPLAADAEEEKRVREHLAANMAQKEEERYEAARRARKAREALRDSRRRRSRKRD